MLIKEDKKYILEENVGFNLVPAIISTLHNKLYAISGKNVFSYDIDSGKRLNLFQHSNDVIGLHLFNKQLLSITNNGQIFCWNCDTGTEIFKVSCEKNIYFNWSYEVNDSNCDSQPSIYLYGQKLTIQKDDLNSIEPEESSSDNSCVHFGTLFLLDLTFLEEKNSIPKLKRILDIPERINTKNQLAVASDLAVICIGRKIKILPFSSKKYQINGPLYFEHKTKILTENDNLLSFNEVHIINNFIYASLNIGRLYVWNYVRDAGLDHNNKSFINVRNCSFKSVITQNQTAFTGDGECTITKWNLSTSGNGRWHRAEYLDVESPIESLLLNHDATYLAAVLTDNTVYIIKTATMTILCTLQGINWNKTVSSLDWLKLNIDPAQPEYIVTNSQLGNIQWINPIKWKTVTSFNVCEENPPPEDHFNLANYLWLNVYLVHFTYNRFVTCECRRNNFQQSYLKIYQRVTPGSIQDFRLEESVVISKRIAFVRSNFDEMQYQNEESLTLQEFLRIDCDGVMNVHITNSRQLGRWHIDPNRNNIFWQKGSIVLSCSRIRNNAFATVQDFLNENGFKQNYVLLWRFPVALKIFQVIECLTDACQVEWAPPNAEAKSILLISCKSKIVSYDAQNASLIWIVEQTNFLIFSSQLICFAYNKKKVVCFNALTGEITQIFKFSHLQQQIVATGDQIKENIRFVGISDKGLSVLKLDIAQNSILQQINLNTKKKTPFSELWEKTSVLTNGSLNTNNNFAMVNNYQKKLNCVSLQKELVPASKIFDGPAYTLAPLTQIAPLYIRSCLISKKKK